MIYTKASTHESLAVQIADKEFQAGLLKDAGDEAGGLELEADALMMEARVKRGVRLYELALDLELKASRLRLRAIDIRLGRAG